MQVCLGPLFVLVLMHDQASGEREAGQLRLLAAQPGASWRLRIALRYLLVSGAVLAPFAVGANIAQALRTWGGACRASRLAADRAGAAMCYYTLCKSPHPGGFFISR